MDMQIPHITIKDGILKIKEYIWFSKQLPHFYVPIVMPMSVKENHISELHDFSYAIYLPTKKSKQDFSGTIYYRYRFHKIKWGYDE